MDEKRLKITYRSYQVMRDLRAVKATQPPHLLSGANPSVVQTHNMYSRTQRGAPPARIALVTDFRDLVTRELATLAEETEA
jgi:hypothetical protein